MKQSRRMGNRKRVSTHQDCSKGIHLVTSIRYIPQVTSPGGGLTGIAEGTSIESLKGADIECI
jgi:hypothetical protein